MFWTALSMGALGVAEIVALLALTRLLSADDMAYTPQRCSSSIFRHLGGPRRCASDRLSLKSTVLWLALLGLDPPPARDHDVSKERSKRRGCPFQGPIHVEYRSHHSIVGPTEQEAG
jgi:hypothetical protein